MENLPNYQLFIVKPLGSTNTRGQRVSIHDVRFNKRIIIPWNYSLNYSGDMGQEFLESKGYKLIGSAADKGLDYYFAAPVDGLFTELSK
jgi:hypothetical protein